MFARIWSCVPIAGERGDHGQVETRQAAGPNTGEDHDFGGVGTGQGLGDCAALHQVIDEERESVAEFISLMLEAFLEGDRAFARARKTAAPVKPADRFAGSCEAGGRQLAQGEARSNWRGDSS